MPRIFEYDEELRKQREIQNIRRCQIRHSKKEFEEFIKILNKNTNYTLEELVETYNIYFQLDPPMTPIGFGKINEVREYFEKKRIGHSERLMIYKLKEDINE